MENVQSRLKRIIDSVTYKPNWKISIIEDIDYGINYVMLQFVFKTKDVSNITNDIIISRTSSISLLTLNVMNEFSDKEWVNRLLWRVIKEMEIHELDEWLKFKGKCIKEPHKEG